MERIGAAKRMTFSNPVYWAAAATLLFANSIQAQAKKANADGSCHALLIGCTQYPNLPTVYQLRGADNDVRLMRYVLTTKFGFSDRDIVTLSQDAGGERLRPTRANIEREFRGLAKKACRGDQVVILLAGHGSQQPDDNPDDPDDFEPDGLDEIFLPADTGNWDPKKRSVTNAIVDDQLRAWLKDISATGATVWLIVDSCHAGTMSRDPSSGTIRGIRADQLVPEEALEQARQAAASRFRNRPPNQPQTPRQTIAREPNLTALYAVTADDVELELLLPKQHPSRKPHGLLTFTLCQVLLQAATPLTYTELTERIRGQYVQMGYCHKTPIVEGKGRDREVLGLNHWKSRSSLVLSQHGQRIAINAGLLHGLDEGCILAVYPPVGQDAGTHLHGHVRISKADMHESLVEPCAYRQMPSPSPRILADGRCELVYRDLGELRLRVAVEKTTATEHAQLQKLLKQRWTDPTSLIQFEDDHSRADWFVSIDRAKALLISASERAASRNRWTIPVAARVAEPWLVDQLTETLTRIARAHNLLQLAPTVTDDRARGKQALMLEVELRRFKDAQDRHGQSVAKDARGLVFHPGDILGFRVRNPNAYPIDVTFLFLAANYAIEPYFPDSSTVADNRVQPGQSIPIPSGSVTADSLGMEHMIIIAVRGEGPFIDFTCLAQPSLERARGRMAKQLSDSPLSKLLQRALFGVPGVRGQPANTSTYSLMRYDWRIERRPGK